MDSSNGNTENIFNAAGLGDLEAVQYHITTKKVNVNSKLTDGGTALMKACANGHLNVAKYLIEKGANVNQADKWGYSALLWAVDRHIAGLNMIQYLVEHKADINAKDKQKGYTALHWVAEHGDLEVVKYLVEKGARVDEKANKGETPLHLAATNNRLNVLHYFIDERRVKFTIFEAAEKGLTNAVKYFIEQKNKVVNAVDQNGWTVLHRAAFSGNVETVKYLIVEKNANVDASNARNTAPITPLHAAAMKGNKDVVIYLLENGASLDTKDNDGRTSLFWASYHGHLDLIKYLIDAMKGDVNNVDNTGKTLLHATCWKGNEEVARFLIEEKHINANAQDNGGRTPLMECIQQGKLNIFEYLLEQISDPVNVKLVDKNGSNAVHYAAYKNSVSALKRLVEKGCDYLLRNQKGQTPLDLASVLGNFEAVKYLINNLGVTYIEQIFVAAEKGQLGLVRYLVEVKGKSANATNEQGWTLLHKASYGGQMNMVKYLVEKASVNVNVKNSQNGIPFTPLHAASQAGHIQIVKFLTQKGANVATRDVNGRTPLFWAADNGFLEIVKYFANEKKADVRQKDKSGNPVLHAAGGNGHLKIVKYLIEEKGVNVNEKDDDGLTLLFRTVGNPDLLKVFHYLLDERQADWRIANNKGRTCLHEAARLGLLDTVKVLVKHGADIGAKDKEGQTPVYAAVSGTYEDGGHLDVVRYFLDEEKADIRQKINDGSTLLHGAAVSGPLEVVKYLVEEKNMDVNAQDNDGYSVLFDSIYGGVIDVFHYLLEEKSANFRARDKYKQTCLHEAAAKGHLEVVKTLVDRGADMNAKDFEGSTPVYFAALGNLEKKSGGHLDILRYFIDEKKANVRQRLDDGNTLLHAAATSGPLDAVKYLVEEKGLDVNAKDNNGYTIIFDAVSSGQLDIFRYLLEEKKADFQIASRWDETCLHEAAKKGYIEMVKALVERGANINAKNEDGNTPLYLATFAKGGNQLEVAKYLKAKGARQNRRRRDVSTQDDLSTMAINSASKHYSIINTLAHCTQNVVASIISSSVESSKEVTELESSWPNVLNLSWLVLLNAVGYSCGKLFGFSAVRRKFQHESALNRGLLMSPSQVMEQRFDPNAVVAVHRQIF